jgi:hypothetical protein
MKPKLQLPDTDVYAVERQAGGFLVRHFPSREAATSCCHIEIAPRGDESESATLARAALVIERHHGRTT